MVQRKNHFSYEDAGQAETSELNEQLRQRLEQLQSQRDAQREQLRQNKANLHNTTKYLFNCKVLMTVKINC